MATKVKPAIYNGYHGWGWVKLTELCEIIGTTPTLLFTHFTPLSKDADRKVLAIEMMGMFYNSEFEALIALELEAQETAKKIGGDDADQHEVIFKNLIESIFLPAGWALDVLKAREEGYISFTLSCEYITGDQQIPENWKVISHNTGFDNQYWVAIGAKLVL